jgi:hypothetical protein
VRATVLTGTGQKRTQFLPVAAGGGPGGGASLVEIEIDEEERP